MLFGKRRSTDAYRHYRENENELLAGERFKIFRSIRLAADQFCDARLKGPMSSSLDLICLGRDTVAFLQMAWIQEASRISFEIQALPSCHSLRDVNELNYAGFVPALEL